MTVYLLMETDLAGHSDTEVVDVFATAAQANDARTTLMAWYAAVGREHGEDVRLAVEPKEVRGVPKQTCDTCRYSVLSGAYGGTLSCQRLPGEYEYIACEVLGNGCRAHRTKEAA